MFKHNSFEFKAWLLVAVFVVPLSIALQVHNWSVIRQMNADQQASSGTVERQRAQLEGLRLRMNDLRQAAALRAGNAH